MRFNAGGGDCLKFSDVVLAVATAAVTNVLVLAVLSMVLILPLGSQLGFNVAGNASILVAGLIAGYLFAVKIQEESRMKAVGKIAVLSALVQMFAVIITFTGNSHYGAWMTDSMLRMFSTGAWVTMDWFVYEEVVLLSEVALNVVFTLLFGSIGLYVGSMLRKPKKTLVMKS